MFVVAKINKQKVIHFLLFLKGDKIIMSNYLTSHFRGRYRILCEYDKTNNQFPKKLNGTFEDVDCYIACQNNIRIFHYGGRILEAYIPSLQRGHNIIKAIKEQFQENIIFDVEETDSEVLFKFNAKYMKDLESILKPRTSGASISPFSSKNLPRNKDYKIPDEDLKPYKNLIENLHRNQLILVGKYTTAFLKSLVTKKNTWDMVKADMASKGLRGKEYIYSIGQWSKYINYLERNIQ